MLLTDFCVRVYRSINHSKAAVSPKPIPVYVRAHRSLKAGEHCSTCRQSNRMKDALSQWVVQLVRSSWHILLARVSSRQFSCSLLLWGCSSCLCHFQAAVLSLILPGSLIWASPKHLSWDNSYFPQALHIALGKKGPSEIGSCIDSLEIDTSLYLLSVLKSFPEWWCVSSTC